MISSCLSISFNVFFCSLSPLTPMHTWRIRIAYVFTVLSCARSKLKHFVNLTADFISTWCGTVCLTDRMEYCILILNNFQTSVGLFKHCLTIVLSWIYSWREGHSVINLLHVFFTYDLRKFSVRPQRQQCSRMVRWLIMCTTALFSSCL